ncbi:MAG: hypothetical protein ACOVO9_07395 [Bacteroidia bacterium]
MSVLLAPNPPPARPTEWLNAPYPLRLTIINNGLVITNARIKATLKNTITNKTIIGTSQSNSRLITVNKGINNFNSNSLFSSFEGASLSDFNLTNGGSLVPGNYQICLELYNSQNIQIGSAACQQFTITGVQPPVLTIPSNNEVISVSQALAKVFQWQAVTPSTNVDYKIEIFEINNNQNLIGAIANGPIETQIIKGSTQFIWINAQQKINQRRNTNRNITTFKYFWRVQAVNSVDQTPVGANNGLSEYRYFTVTTSGNTQAVVTPTRTTVSPTNPTTPVNPENRTPVLQSNPVSNRPPVGNQQTPVTSTNTSYNEPVLRLPAKNSIIIDLVQSDNEVKFTWDSVTPQIFGVKYALYVYQLNKGQKKSDYKNNTPILKKENLGTLSYTWRPEGNYDDDVTFVWNVKAYKGSVPNGIGKKTGLEKGFSDEQVFIIKGKPKVLAKEAEPIVPKEDATLTFENLKDGYTFKWDSGTTFNNEPGINYELEIFEKRSGKADTLISNIDKLTKTEFKWTFVPKYDALYTWRVKTKDKNSNLIGAKDKNKKGISDKKMFLVESKVIEDSIVITDCDGNKKVVKFNAKNSSGEINFVDKYIKVNNFNMLVTSISRSENKNGIYGLSGKGSIVVPWLFTPIHVEFEYIKVNGSNKTMTEGTIYALQDESIGQIPAFLKTNSTLNITKNQAKKLNENLELQKEKKIVSNTNLDKNLLNASNNIPKLPLGISNVMGYTLAITEMSFGVTENKNKLVCIATLPYSKETTKDILAFAAVDIQFDQSSPSKSGGKLVLLEDFNIVDPAEESYGITIVSKYSKSFSTYIEWDCKGFKNLKAAVEVSLPRKWLVPTISDENVTPDTTAKVVASALVDINNLNDWLLTLKLNSCEIVGLEGSELKIDAITFDNSDKRNPPEIKFPKGFTGAKDEKFRGFYIQKADLVLPKFFNKATDNTGIAISVDNFIISRTGLSGSIAVGTKENPIINLASGTLGDFQASLEKVEIEILNKSITKAEVTGRLMLPICQAGTSDANALAYTARWNDGTKKKGSSVLLAINPSGEKGLSADLFGGAVLNLSNNSVISMEYTKGKSKNSKGTVQAKVNLNGDISINKRLLDKIDANLSMTFENLGFNYDNSNPKVKNFTFNKASFNFASPQKKVGGFDVTLSSVEISDFPTNPNHIANAKLSFGINVSLGSKFKGKTNLSLIGGIKKVNGQFKPVFIDAQIDTIAIEGTVAAVSLKGSLVFYSNDPVYGQGFKGEAAAVFEKVGAVTATVQFGSVLSATTNQNYNYWFAEAKLILRTPIPIVNPIGLKGAGIGAWYHMSTSGASPVSLQDADKAEDVKTSKSGMEFKPDDKNLFGFRISGVFVNTKSERGFNGDLTFSASFTKSEGIEKLSLTGEGYVGCSLKDRDKALLKGTLDASYDFTKDYLNVKVTVNLRYPPASVSPVAMIKTVGDAEFIMTVDGQKKINGEPAWSITMGTPVKPNNILYYNVFNLWFYMRMGNDLEPIQFNQKTINGLARVSPTLKPEKLSEAATNGKGFDFGFGFDQSGSVNFGPFSGSYAVGGEMNLALIKYDANNGCVTDKMDYWYARGGAAAYAAANVKFMGVGFDLAAGALMQGGAPDPLWVKGRVAGRVSVKIFIITIGFNANVGFTYGTPCRPTKNLSASGAAGQLEYESIDDLEIGGLIEPIDFLYHSSGQVDKLTPIRFVSLFDVSFAKDDASIHKTFSIDVMEGEVKVTKTYKVLVEWRRKGCDNSKIDSTHKQSIFNYKKLTSGNQTWYEIGYSWYNGEVRNLFANSECVQTQLKATLWVLQGNVWVVAKNSKGVEISRTTDSESFTTHSK